VPYRVVLCLALIGASVGATWASTQWAGEQRVLLSLAWPARDGGEEILATRGRCHLRCAGRFYIMRCKSSLSACNPLTVNDPVRSARILQYVTTR
jgi:hypothetical protein